jgi:hypothetical protein
MGDFVNTIENQSDYKIMDMLERGEVYYYCQGVLIHLQKQM